MALIANANLILKDKDGNAGVIKTLTDADVAKLSANIVQTATNKTDIEGLDTRLSKIVGKDGNVIEATSEVLGAVKLATDTDITNADAKKVVTAAQLASVKGDLSKVYKFKGTVATYEELPSSGVQNGDVYNVEAAHAGVAAGANYAAIVAENGDITWDNLAGILDVSDFATKSGDNAFTGTNTVVTPTEVSAAEQIANKGYVDSVVAAANAGVIHYSAAKPEVETLENNTSTFYPAEDLL